MKTALFCGFGWAARELWLPALLDAGFREFGIYDRQPRRPDPAPGDACFHILDGLDGLDAGKYDVAVVASPNASHAGHAHRLLESGIPVVIEKPVCASMADLQALGAASSQGGAGFVRSCSAWYDPHFAEFLALLHASGPVEPTRVRASWIRRSGIPNSRWLTQSKYALAGSSIDLGWHLLECTMAAAGYSALAPTDVRFALQRDGVESGAGLAGWHGSGNVNGGSAMPIDVDTAASITCRSEDGLPVEIETAWCSKSDGDRVTIEVHGSDSICRLTTIFGMSDDAACAPSIEIVEDGQTHARELAPKPRGAAHARMVQDFVDKEFDPERLGQTWDQLRSLTATTEAIVGRQSEWRATQSPATDAMAVIDDADQLDLLVKRHGSFSLAASADQPGMRYFGNEEGIIAFSELDYAGRASRICLGEPLAPPELWPQLVRRLIGCSDNVIWVHIGEELCKILAGEGMFINNIGWEAMLQLEGYDFGGPRKQNIRNAVRRCESLGYVVLEVDPDGPAWLPLDRISQDWLRRKGGERPENRLITRPFMHQNNYQRIFAMKDPDGQFVHFITLDEIWHDHAVAGYHSNINRSLERSPKNADYAIHAHIVEVLQQEGVGHLSLGLCPDFGAKQFGKRANAYTTLALDASRKFGRTIYNFEGITQHKKIFRPSRRRAVYVGTQNGWPSIDVLGVFRGINLI